jgi:hypothetical protein
MYFYMNFIDIIQALFTQPVWLMVIGFLIMVLPDFIFKRGWTRAGTVYLTWFFIEIVAFVLLKVLGIYNFDNVSWNLFWVILIPLVLSWIFKLIDTREVDTLNNRY